MRIPYDALRMCESYTFPTLTDDATKTSTLEVQIWPYDDGRPESVTSVVESISKKQLKSCTEIKMAKATKCAKQLMAIQMAKLDKQLMEVAYPTYMNRGGGDTEMWKLTIWEHYDSAFQFAARPCEIDFKDVLHENNLLVLRDHFFRFFVSLLKSYEKHIKRPGAKNSSSSSKKPRGEYLSNAVSKCSCNYR